MGLNKKVKFDPFWKETSKLPHQISGEEYYNVMMKEMCIKNPKDEGCTK